MSFELCLISHLVNGVSPTGPMRSPLYETIQYHASLLRYTRALGLPTRYYTPIQSRLFASCHISLILPMLEWIVTRFHNFWSFMAICFTSDIFKMVQLFQVTVSWSRSCKSGEICRVFVGLFPNHCFSQSEPFVICETTNRLQFKKH